MRTLLLAGLLVAPLAAEVFWEPFDDNGHGWRLDDQWRLEAGALRANGLAGQILVVGCDAPSAGDFTATLRAEATPAEAGNWGYGLLYRYDPRRRVGCFVAVGAGHGYGFGRVEEGRFTLVQQGTSGIIDAARPLAVELTVRGDRHALRVGEVLVDVWRDQTSRAGSVGLLVIEGATVRFEELRIESFGVSPAAPGQLGPLPPAAGTQEVVGRADLVAAADWRRQWNQMRRALGEPALPDGLDAVDVAVVALLKDYHLHGRPAPATVLARWLALPGLAAGDGPAGRAALEYWLQYAGRATSAEDIGGQEDFLAGLTWYQEVRARVARSGAGPDAELQARVEAQRARLEVGLMEAERGPRYAAWTALGERVLVLAAGLVEQP